GFERGVEREVVALHDIPGIRGEIKSSGLMKMISLRGVDLVFYKINEIQRWESVSRLGPDSAFVTLPDRRDRNRRNNVANPHTVRYPGGRTGYALDQSICSCCWRREPVSTSSPRSDGRSRHRGNS